VYRHGSLLAVHIVMNPGDSHMEPCLNSWIFIIDVENVQCPPHPEFMTRPIVLSIHHSAGSSDGGRATRRRYFFPPPAGAERRSAAAALERLEFTV